MLGWGYSSEQGTYMHRAVGLTTHEKRGTKKGGKGSGKHLGQLPPNNVKQEANDYFVSLTNT